MERCFAKFGRAQLYVLYVAMPGTVENPVGPRHLRTPECVTLELLDCASQGDLPGCLALLDAQGLLSAGSKYWKPRRSKHWEQLTQHWPFFSGAESGVAALHCAAAAGHIDVCHALLERGADPTQSTRYGLTPLHFAALNGHEEVLVALLGALREAGLLADANAPALNQFLNHGPTPLHLACCCADAERGARCVALMLDAGARPQYADDRGRTALHHAASCANARACALLVASGALVNCTDEAGSTPIQCAADAVHPPELKAEARAAVHRELFWLPGMRVLWLGHLQAGGEGGGEAAVAGAATESETPITPCSPALLLRRLTPELLRMIARDLVASSRP